LLGFLGENGALWKRDGGLSDNFSEEIGRLGMEKLSTNGMQ